MTNSIISRRQFLATAVVVPLPGLLHRQAGRDIFTLPVHAWRALASAAVTMYRLPWDGESVSADSAAVMAHVMKSPEQWSYYRDLCFGMFEPTPEMEAGQLWLTDKYRLQSLCAFLQRGGCVVEENDTWVVLSRRAS